MVKIAILGYGTVGGGVAKVLDENADKVKAYTGKDVEAGYILDLRDFPGDPHEKQVVRDMDAILADPDVRVVCETMGGTEPAYAFTKKALEKGISVCTSNKEMVAAHGPELIRIAKEHHCSYLFEASAGGGIPVLRPFSTVLMHERIDRVYGILNGTTNYILTRMVQDGAEFEAALRRAQEKGYAEKDPTADIEGHDACRKTSILASLASGTYVQTKDIPTEGITKISAIDNAYARENGYVIKLVGSVTADADGTVGALVAPRFVPADHPLASVNEVFNAVMVHGNMLGNVMFYGRGAGRDATASAVVSDVLDALKHDGETVFVNLTETPAKMMGRDRMTARFFVRVDESQKAAAVKTFGENISVKESKNFGGEFAFITSEMSEKQFEEACASIDGVRGFMRVLS
ncbi:MAG: homoserine dehydrogenase [Lachnospiraceae bacterium]|nr:homoserine dehydrogenase [Lachnospiraceae bacterium]